MTPEQLAEIESRPAAATDGPWKQLGDQAGDVVSVADHRPGGLLAYVSVAGGRGRCREEADANAAFIAAARTDVPALCAALRDDWDMIRVLRRDQDAYQQGWIDALYRLDAMVSDLPDPRRKHVLRAIHALLKGDAADA